MIHMIMRNQTEIDVSRDERQTLIVLAVLPLLKEATINNKFDRTIIWLFYNNQIALASYLWMHSHNVCVEPVF